METIKSFIGNLVNFNEKVEERESRRESRKARIFDDDNLVCTRDNRENCYDPTSIRVAFKPLGIFAKIFGLFPKYDFAFVDKLESKGAQVVHVLDYCYSLTVFGIITGGALVCTLHPPGVILRMRQDSDADEESFTDYYVNMAVVYLTMAIGILSLFAFPSAGSKLVEFLEHFTNLDKILRFDGRMEERNFALRVMVYMIAIFIGSLASFVILYVVEIREEHQEKISLTDYIMPPVMAVSSVALLIPSGLALFFLNAIWLRLYHFNKVTEGLVKGATPSCFLCVSYSDYGKELDQNGKGNEENNCLDFAKDLEKLRILHSEIRGLAKELGCIFGSHLMVDFLFSIIGLILYTYILIYMSRGTISNWFIYIILDSFLVIKLLVISAYAQHISCYGTAARMFLQKVSLSRISSDSQMQVQMFLSSLETPIVIAASGFFNIDKSLITSIVGAITTYFIILIQFKVGDSKKDLRALTSICSTNSNLSLS